MIIRCPNCGTLFNLTTKPSKTFKCPKCKYSTPFSVVLSDTDNSWDKVTNAEPGLDADNNSQPTTSPGSDATRIATNVIGEKTMLVPGLQAPTAKRAALRLRYRGVDCGIVQLPPSGNFSLGRKSSDSTAQIRLTPDISMSRIHAGMRTLKTQTGLTIYQITSAKVDNPVFVNGQPIAKGKACNLKNGDKLRMGETDIIFQIF